MATDLGIGSCGVQKNKPDEWCRVHGYSDAADCEWNRPPVFKAEPIRLSEEQRAHIVSWSDEEWQAVIRNVRPSSDIVEAVRYVNELRKESNGARP